MPLKDWELVAIFNNIRNSIRDNSDFEKLFLLILEDAKSSKHSLKFLSLTSEFKYFTNNYRRLSSYFLALSSLLSFIKFIFSNRSILISFVRNIAFISNKFLISSRI